MVTLWSFCWTSGLKGRGLGASEAKWAKIRSAVISRRQDRGVIAATMLVGVMVVERERSISTQQSRISTCCSDRPTGLGLGRPFPDLGLPPSDTT